MTKSGREDLSHAFNAVDAVLQADDAGLLVAANTALCIANLVVDSASIEVNRRARRAKTDRLDSDKLLSMNPSAAILRS